MRDSQLAEANMVKAEIALYQLNSSKIKQHGPLSDSWEAVLALDETLDENMLKQSSDTTSLTGTKTQQRQQLSAEIDYQCDLFMGFCAKQKLKQVRTQAQLLVANRYFVSDLEFVGLAQQFVQLVQPYIAQLTPYGLTEADLTRVSEWGNAYETIVTGNKLSRAEKAGSTKLIHTTLKEIIRVFKEEIDLLMVVFKRSDPALYEEYIRLRKIVYRHKHKAAQGSSEKAEVTITVLDAETAEPIEGASVADGNAVLPDLTDEDGETTHALTAGVHELTAIAEGYKSAVIQSEDLKPGQEYRVEISLSK